MRVIAAVIGLCVVSACAQAGPAEQWSRLRVPAAGPATVMGSPAAGCIAGAVALPPEGDGYQVLRLERNRFWGHPRTVDFVRELGAAARAEGLGPLLIGDMSQPRGGPMAYGHGSHQTGLDVDIWFKQGPLDEAARAQPVGVSMVRNNRVNPATFTEAQLRMLELAARSPEVDRIFVNPPIKAAACKKGGAWVAKLRPWWGHDEHFHVRLSCPEGEAGCVPQAPVPDGDGCGGELASWSAKPTVLPPGDRPNHRNPILPAACSALLDGEGGVIQVKAR
jgi:penicillin-insensitive murein endopeptidase